MSELLGGWKRTNYCANFTKADAGKQVTLMGWANVRRDLGELLPEDDAVKLGSLIGATEVMACQAPHRHLRPRREGLDLDRLSHPTYQHHLVHMSSSPGAAPRVSP